MRRSLWLTAALAGALLVTVLPASAITNGSLDGTAHPAVGLLVAQDAAGDPLWRCSGTLLSATVLVTAGHCTHSLPGAPPVDRVLVWFEPGPFDLGAGFGADPAHPCAGVSGYPCGGADATGTAETIDGFDDATFWLHDVGVVVLGGGGHPLPADEYGVLPAANALEGLRPGAATTFTTVGYGAERYFPDQGASSLKDVTVAVRMVAHPHLIQIDNPSLGAQSLVLSGNASTGGTCHGDSGGPNFVGGSNVIAGVTSYGKSPTCGGQGGVFRLDQPAVRDWVLSFLAP